MTEQEIVEEKLAGIADIAYRQVLAEIEDNADEVQTTRHQMADATSAALHAGADLEAALKSKTSGEERAKAELGKDLLRTAAASARRKRDSDARYEKDIHKAARLFSTRQIAEAVGVGHTTVRSILQRPAPQDVAEGAES